MKTILVDAINGYVFEDGTIFAEMHNLLESYPNRKIVLTGANDEQFRQFKLDEVPYEVFTLKHNPEKTDPTYYKIMLEHFGLNAADTVYFEHNKDAAQCAQSVGIPTLYYDESKKDLDELETYINQNL